MIYLNDFVKPYTQIKHYSNINLFLAGEVPDLTCDECLSQSIKDKYKLNIPVFLPCIETNRAILDSAIKSACDSIFDDINSSISLVQSAEASISSQNFARITKKVSLLRKLITLQNDNFTDFDKSATVYKFLVVPLVQAFIIHNAYHYQKLFNKKLELLHKELDEEDIVDTLESYDGKINWLIEHPYNCLTQFDCLLDRKSIHERRVNEIEERKVMSFLYETWKDNYERGTTAYKL